MFLKTFNSEFSHIEVWLTKFKIARNGRQNKHSFSY